MIKSNEKTKKTTLNSSIEPTRRTIEKNFSINSRVEICAVLQSIMERKTLVTVYFDQSNRFILTSILAVDPINHQLVVDYGIDEKLNQNLLNSKKVTFVTSQNRVKVEFSSSNTKKIYFDGNDAFLVHAPDSLLRMQRRNYFRVTTPTVNPLKCIIPLSPNNRSETAEVTLLDISCGGIAVIDHHPSVSFEPGIFFENIQISLPQLGTIAANIEVKNTYENTLRNGLSCKRAGCEFANPPAKNFILIQKYITKREKLYISD